MYSKEDYQSGAEPPHSKGSASPRLSDHYQVKDGEYAFAKAWSNDKGPMTDDVCCSILGC
jgi:hypothetical protein